MKEKARDLITIIQEISIEYLKRQIKNGADYIQVFESWAGLLDDKLYDEFIIEPNKEISKKIRENFRVKHELFIFLEDLPRNILNLLKK